MRLFPKERQLLTHIFCGYVLTRWVGTETLKHVLLPFSTCNIISHAPSNPAVGQANSTKSTAHTVWNALYLKLKLSPECASTRILSLCNLQKRKKFRTNLVHQNGTSEHTFYRLLRLIYHLPTFNWCDNGLHIQRGGGKHRRPRHRMRCTVLFTHIIYYIHLTRDDDDDDDNKLQMGRHPVAVVISHITYSRTMKVDYSRFSWGGLRGKRVVATCKGKTETIPAFALGPRKTKKSLCRDGRSKDLPATDL
jgi:hypothetical protein